MTREYGPGRENGVMERYALAEKIMVNLLDALKITREEMIENKDMSPRRKYAEMCRDAGIGSIITAKKLHRNHATIVYYLKWEEYKAHRRARYDRSMATIRAARTAQIAASPEV